MALRRDIAAGLPLNYGGLSPHLPLKLGTIPTAGHTSTDHEPGYSQEPAPDEEGLSAVKQATRTASPCVSQGILAWRRSTSMA